MYHLNIRNNFQRGRAEQWNGMEILNGVWIGALQSFEFLVKFFQLGNRSVGIHRAEQIQVPQSSPLLPYSAGTTLSITHSVTLVGERIKMFYLFTVEQIKQQTDKRDCFQRQISTLQRRKAQKQRGGALFQRQGRNNWLVLDRSIVTSARKDLSQPNLLKATFQAAKIQTLAVDLLLQQDIRTVGIPSSSAL